MGMDRRTELRDFLISRRAKITPVQAGLTAYGDNRRVPGLRREEVAMLAGLSVDYYTRLERGNARGASDAVLDSLARALRLDEAERAHLFDLARAASTTAPRKQRPAKVQVRPVVRQILDSMTIPAYVRNRRMDILAVNTLGQAVFSTIFAGPARPVNVARFVFLDPAAPAFYDDWEWMVDVTVAVLRTEVGRSPYDKALMGLIGELSTHSAAFRARWAAHDVRFHRTGAKTLHHPVVGELTLSFEAMELSAETDLVLLAYTAEAGSPSADALSLLASWSATTEQEPTASNAEHA